MLNAEAQKKRRTLLTTEAQRTQRFHFLSVGETADRQKAICPKI